MGDDEDMWNRMLPGFYEYPNSVTWQDSIPTAIRGEDGDHIWGSDYFTLDAGETKRIASVLVFGYTNEEVLDKIRLAEALYYSNFDTTLVSVDDDKNIPLTYSLSQNFPNPFNPTTTIRYQLTESGKVSLIIYDILGREVKTLVNKFQINGKYEVSFNSSSLASGVCFYRLMVNDYIDVKKMLLLK